MATISTSQYLDNGTARTAWEAWTINSGAELTIRTDSRVHANAPVSMTGSFWSMTINEGKIIIDAQNVRWLAYNTWTWNVPAIWTTVSQWGVSGYLLGVWASLTSAPTTAWSAMPATGFIKFRETSWWFFAAGALTWIGASATWADTLWWIEIVGDETMLVSVPRLWEFRTRGGYFPLGTTNGSVGQVIQLPTNGWWANTHVAWVSVETASWSGIYEDYPALNWALSNGWARQNLGTPVGGGDLRQKFVKGIWSGQIQFWEAVALAWTYASLAAQAWTYATIAHSMTYTWSANIVECYIAAGHGLRTWQQTGLDFTSGGATAFDGTYTVTVLDAYRFTVPLSWSGASWNVTSRPGVIVTFTAHGLNVGESTYCDFTTGTWVDGTYEVYGVPSTSTYQIKYPHIVALTSGNVSCIHTLVVTFTAHALTVGNRVTLDFTTWSGVDGDYTIKANAANTFNINYAHTPTTSGNVTINMTIGYVPPTGCNIRVPNIFFRGCTTGARATNVVPNVALATRPEFATTSAWAIDIEYGNFDWYCTFLQPYSVKIHKSFIQDTLYISECATALNLDQIGIWMYGSIDTPTLNLVANYAAGSLSNIRAERWNAPWSADHALFMQYCIGQTLTNVRAWIIQFARLTGYPFQISNCQNITLNNPTSINSQITFSTSKNCVVNDVDHIDRYIGYTNATSNYVVRCDGWSDNIMVDGVTFWGNGVIPSVHSYSWIINPAASTNIKLRNIGSLASPLVTHGWAPNLTAIGSMYVTTGNNFSIKVQRVYITSIRSSSFMIWGNSDKNVTFESIWVNPYIESTNAVLSHTTTNLNGIYKWLKSVVSTTWQTSIYWSHFTDSFEGTSYGRLQLAMNEPTTDTASQFTMVSGVQKYNSVGGIIMWVIWNQAIWEDNVFRKGHTGFADITPTMTGGTIGNYTLEYQVDLGSGYWWTWKTLNTTNLTWETVDPSVWFRMKIRITTTTTNASAIATVTVYTLTSVVAQWNLYPLDVVTLSLTWLISWSDVVIYEAWTTTVLAQQEDNSWTLYEYTYETLQNIDIGIFLAWYIPYYIRGYSLTSGNVSLPIAQVVDRAYLT